MPELIDTMIERARFAVSEMDAYSIDAYRTYSEPLPRHYEGDALADVRRRLWEALGYKIDPEQYEKMCPTQRTKNAA